MMFDIPEWIKVEMNGYSYDPTPMPVLTTWLVILELIPVLLICLLGTFLKISQILYDLALFCIFLQNVVLNRKRLMVKYFFGNQINKLINSAGLADYRIDKTGKKIMTRSVVLTFFFFNTKNGLEIKIDPNGIANSRKCAEIAEDMSLAFNGQAYLVKSDFTGYTYNLTFPIDYGVSDDEF